MNKEFLTLNFLKLKRLFITNNDFDDILYFLRLLLSLKKTFTGFLICVKSNGNKIIAKKTGIEPVHAVLKTAVLPLNYISFKNIGNTGLGPSLVTYSK